MTQRIAEMVAVLLVGLVSAPSLAQSSTRMAASFHYDLSQEVTLKGVALNVLPTAGRGMLNGSHVILGTSSGSIDVSLGAFAFVGKDVLSIGPSEQLEVTGVMATVSGTRVFLARTVKAGDRVFTIRNQHGIPVSPAARERLQQRTSQNGDSL